MRSIWITAVMTFFMAKFSVMTGQETVEYGGLTWYLNYEEAKKVAQAENKPIIILFTGSDWCPPCRALRKEVFPNRIFKQEAKNVILVLADFPKRKQLPVDQRQRNRQLAATFLGGRGLPTMVAVDWHDDSVIRTITGYNFYRHDINPHIEFMRFVIKKFKGN